MDFKKLAVEILDECEKSPSSLESIIREIEKQAIFLALNEAGHAAGAADKLRLNRTTLVEKKKRLGIVSRVKYSRANTYSLEGTDDRSLPT